MKCKTFVYNSSDSFDDFVDFVRNLQGDGRLYISVPENKNFLIVNYMPS